MDPREARPTAKAYEAPKVETKKVISRQCN
jgi:hypothetical protein